MKNLKHIKILVNIYASPDSIQSMKWAMEPEFSAESSKPDYFRVTAQKLQDSFIPSLNVIKNAINKYGNLPHVKTVELQVWIHPVDDRYYLESFQPVSVAPFIDLMATFDRPEPAAPKVVQQGRRKQPVYGRITEGRTTEALLAQNPPPPPKATFVREVYTDEWINRAMYWFDSICEELADEAEYA